VIEELLLLSEKVGKKILTFYKQEFEVQQKENNTPITIADKEAHKLLSEGLQKITPKLPILSEEGELVDFEIRKNWQQYWLIDPLDGTRDFINKTGDFVVSIALIKNNKPILGVIYSPVLKTHYFATKNKGAFKKINNITQKIQTNENIQQEFKVVVGRYSNKSKKLNNFLDERLVKYNFFEVGSALKFCLIAEGKYDFYPKLGPCSEWDSAAGICILEEAGGLVIDENNQPLRYNIKEDTKSPIFFAGSRQFFKQSKF